MYDNREESRTFAPLLLVQRRLQRLTAILVPD